MLPAIPYYQYHAHHAPAPLARHDGQARGPYFKRRRPEAAIDDGRLRAAKFADGPALMLRITRDHRAPPRRRPAAGRTRWAARDDEAADTTPATPIFDEEDADARSPRRYYAITHDMMPRAIGRRRRRAARNLLKRWIMMSRSGARSAPSHEIKVGAQADAEARSSPPFTNLHTSRASRPSPHISAHTLAKRRSSMKRELE